MSPMIVVLSATPKFQMSLSVMLVWTLTVVAIIYVNICIPRGRITCGSAREGDGWALLVTFFALLIAGILTRWLGYPGT